MNSECGCVALLCLTTGNERILKLAQVVSGFCFFCGHFLFLFFRSRDNQSSGFLATRTLIVSFPLPFLLQSNFILCLSLAQLFLVILTHCDVNYHSSKLTYRMVAVRYLQVIKQVILLNDLSRLRWRTPIRRRRPPLVAVVSVSFQRPLALISSIHLLLSLLEIPPMERSLPSLSPLLKQQHCWYSFRREWLEHEKG